MDSVNKEAITKYFVKGVLQENNLMDSPNQIYNVDETGMPLNPVHFLKKARVRTTGDKSQVTFVGCASASGQVIPPYVIFDTAPLNVGWTEGEVPGTT